MLMGEPGHEAAVLHIHMHMGHSGKTGTGQQNVGLYAPVICACTLYM